MIGVDVEMAATVYTKSGRWCTSLLTRLRGYSMLSVYIYQQPGEGVAPITLTNLQRHAIYNGSSCG
jgi:hypothetical protein